MRKYAFQQWDKETMARAQIRDAPISAKQGIEVSRSIRHKTVPRSRDLLARVIAGKTPVRITRFNKGIGHKPGIGPGRFPKKAAGFFLELLGMAEANAQFKGLDASKLAVRHICVNKASRPFRFGRQRRRRAKRSHIEIVIGQDAGAELQQEQAVKAEQKK
ncbi:MAG TPA: 50S ribosomal protein L22 [Candidatus Nanoarchaeia archaeon]|nr:50S ribosomal protein L22 [Candidatus Nanoarchaeia archaeon]